MQKMNTLHADVDLTFDYQGAPKKWNYITDEEAKNQLSLVNPRYNLDEGCRNNCVNCVIAYDLRQRGYDVIAKSRVECNVSKKAAELWNNVEEKTADSFLSY